MNASLFSGFNIECEMEAPIVSPIKVRSAFNSPILKAKVPTPKFEEDLELLSGDSYEAEDKFIEPILRENPNRFTLFPIMKPKLYKRSSSVNFVPTSVCLDSCRILLIFAS